MGHAIFLRDFAGIGDYVAAMLIWLMTLLLFVMFGALGYAKGAIRMLISLVGLFVAALLALPLAPLVRPLIPKMGLENPIWSLLLPPLIVFFVVAVVFLVVSFFGHAKVNLFYKFRADETQRLGWERLNQRLGICVGLVAGAVYSVLIGVVVYVIGYLTVQISPGESETSQARYLNQARADLRSSGLERIVAVFDPAPNWYYEASDLLGLLYHNPPLHSRLASYPPMISLVERTELQEIANDTEFQNLLAGQPSVAQVVEHPRVQAVLGNPELLEQLRALDLKDLNHYLRTGVSEKYQDTPILGRWEVDQYLTFLLEKKRRKNMTAADVKLLRFEMEFVKGFKLFVAPDNTVRLKGPDVSPLVGKLAELAKAVAEGTRPRPPVYTVAPQSQQPAPTQDPAASAQSRMLAQRYGVRQPGGGGGAPAQPVAPVEAQPTTQPAPAPAPMTAAELAAEIAKLPIATLAQGRWKEQDGDYVISFDPAKEMGQFVGTRRSSGVAADVREERLHLKDKDQVMVLSRF